ncbi:hypothetical protein PENSTE_c008G00422 [Penicillium steckii]|uniref:Uncharacterized protein n=1 Tax=Penicillium steckii TaxID=303698 RepID=A0A1V6TBU0_9EURO|nr:hypothetical protein PENSTE_c008G00422 [Penicillium steckii]
MTTNPAPAAPSAIPKNQMGNTGQKERPEEDQKIINHKANIIKPKFRLHAEELRHPSSASFFSLIPDVASTLDTALEAIIRYLYTPPKAQSDDFKRRKKGTSPSFYPFVPQTRSVTLFLRDFGGVAYTTGTELDNDHKEIHLSLPYIKHCTTLKEPLRELVGVLTHELVHCYQHTAPHENDENDTKEKIPHPPGGLIEGIADFVRLKAQLDPPHWKRPQSASERASKWDAGYQHTAYFLAWIEDVWVGEGAIGMLNDRLLRVGYYGENEEDSSSKNEVGFWKGLFGMEVAELWAEYGRFLDGDDQSNSGDQKPRGNWEEEILDPE